MFGCLMSHSGHIELFLVFEHNSYSVVGHKTIIDDQYIYKIF